MAKNDFRSLNQEFDNNVLGLIKPKVFYPYEYMNNFEKNREQLPSKEKFYCPLTGKEASDKEYEHFFKVWNKFDIKTMKGYHDLYLICNTLLLADVFEKFKNTTFKILDYDRL